ncbi:MAG: undecaprenyl-phosphate glucose phosphotransferase [Bacteroidetes bacterium]|nr:undecaprenyl-phosphate glucose phosphotransferase [Bacteroidota bacterium]
MVKNRLSNYEKYLYAFMDLVIFDLVLFINFKVTFGSLNGLFQTKYGVLLLFVNFAWLLAFLIIDSIVDNRRIRTSRALWDFLRSFLLNLLFTLSFIALLNIQYNREFLLGSYLIFFFTGAIARVIARQYVKSYREKGYNFRRMVVVGINDFSQDFVKEISSRKDYGYRFMGYFDLDDISEVTELDGSYDHVDNIYNFLLENRIDEVYISMPTKSSFHIKALIKFCHLNFIKVNFLNETIHALSNRSVYLNVDYNGLTPIVSLAKEPLEVTSNRFLKRVFDLVFSTLVLVLIFPWLLPIVGLLIKLESKGPIFFKQQRSGINYSPFGCYKFRTMRVNALSDKKQATKDDPRITKIGSFLRKSSIDELPQFINVFLGDMSVVGPRPHMLEHTRMYAKLISPFVVRHWVKPGITGLAQAKGYRGETKEVKQMLDRVKMDVFYIQHWSLFLDARIIWKTVVNMLTLQKTGF